MLSISNMRISYAGFSHITRKDNQGNDILGRPKEIGAAWERKGDKQDAIVHFDIVPTDLMNYNGVMFRIPLRP